MTPEKTKEILLLNNLSSFATDENCFKFSCLCNNLIEENKKINLTAIKDDISVVVKHIADSLSVASLISPGATVIDFGCGGGFPSLPLAIARPDIRITALDATSKKIKFVSEQAEKLKLTNIYCISGRGEELAFEPRYREKFDVAVSRAVASLPVLLELCIPFLKVNGKMLAMKGSKWESELDESESCIKTLFLKYVGNADYTLSDGSDEINLKIMSFIKEGHTNNKFPRNYSQISKKHL